ncbi:MAG: Xaa-Pro aminopeptidase [Proteobacteria bacterium]|jgi:Xaa-Pro aminopeptidase|uniref:Xaa-Pro aminopeptidase n=1 Tax=SAR92 bacterium BACL26 MAG-121220-bin70 TaxID=1655626 RepID=A0A0R2U7V2_9GAMM|nr:MAG: Xaa-Pro aminopeptidase [SAR92 bacterium BACL26 MAG-121220-bin70]MDA0796189.1 Xaa-Pro aminopeptidase [Pseudomonadota bacterium]MDA1351675.1 Xaa-Pro aminopeptidase [Pseudomonadota bacterium]
MTITNKEYAARRKDLMALMQTNSIAIIASAPEKVRSRDTHYPYKQNVTLSYLSGFPEPESVMALIPGRPQGEVILFCRDKDPLRETWDGYREGPNGAVANFGADDAFPISDIDDILPGLLEGKDRLYYAIGKDPDFDAHLMTWVNEVRSQRGTGALPPSEFVDLDHFIDEMRLIKTAPEIKVMRKAGEISARAHCRAMKLSRPGLYEYHLQAEIEHEFMISGAPAPAYSSIVGGGKNGCILHYIENRDKLKDGDLVLIDAGCEYQDYAADITRTFPVNGKFSDAQAAIYDVVLRAQEEAIKVIGPGIAYNKANETTIRVITQGLVDLGILKGDVDELIAGEAHREFYMHGAGHWLGMDVHDVGDYKIENKWRVYEPGMVVTIEPGIYISPDNTNVDEKWRGIAVRIEDDVVVTKEGNEIMSAGVPKARDQIEALMATQ